MENSNAEMESLIQAVQQIKSRAESLFGHLDQHELNWHPDPSSWSIGQCLQHLIITNEKYFSQFSQIAEGDYRNGLWKSMSPFTKFWGRFMLKNFGKVVAKKYKSPWQFKPRKEIAPATIVSRFIFQQDEIISFLRNFRKEKIDHIVITSPITSLITLKLSDALIVMVSHEERHLAQAERVLNHPSFNTN